MHNIALVLCARHEQIDARFHMTVHNCNPSADLQSFLHSSADVSAYETAKTLRKSMKKYSKKAQGKGGDVKPRYGRRCQTCACMLPAKDNGTRQRAQTLTEHAWFLCSSDAKSVKNRVRALKPDVQSNSCSTLFVDQTVSQPNLDQILRYAVPGSRVGQVGEVWSMGKLVLALCLLPHAMVMRRGVY